MKVSEQTRTTPAAGGFLRERLLRAGPAVIAGILGLYFPVFLVRENRLTEGVPLGVFSSDGSPYFIILFAAVTASVLFALCSPVLSISERGRIGRSAYGTVLAVTGLILTASLLASAHAEASDLAASGASSRLSPSSGFWSLSGLIVYSFYLSRTSAAVAARLLTFITILIVAVAWNTGYLAGFALYEEWNGVRERFLSELLTHLSLSLQPIIPAAAAALPLGVAAARNRSFEKKLFAAASTIQIIPSLAVFGLLMPVLSSAGRAFPILKSWGIGGLGAAPVLIALTLYALLPLTRGVFLGIRSVPAHLIEAAGGMGMNGGQILAAVEIPLALPAALDGLRFAVVQSVGLATLGALIGAGGLGWFVFQGLGQGADDLVLLSSLSICLIAVAADSLMKRLADLIRARKEGAFS